MRTLLNPWFIAGCLLWLVVHYCRRSGHFLPPVINNYIDDAFAVPVLATLALCFMRLLVIRNNYYVLSPWKTGFIVLYLAVVFEVFLPSLSKTYTSDPIDAMLYAAGGVFFYLVMNKPIVIRRPAPGTLRRSKNCFNE